MIYIKPKRQNQHAERVELVYDHKKQKKATKNNLDKEEGNIERARIALLEIARQEIQLTEVFFTPEHQFLRGITINDKPFNDKIVSNDQINFDLCRALEQEVD